MRTGCVTGSDSNSIPLFMSTNGLGWFRIVPITDHASLCDLANESDPDVANQIRNALAMDVPDSTVAACLTSYNAVDGDYVCQSASDSKIECRTIDEEHVCAPTVASRYRRCKGVKHPAHLTGLQILIRAHHALGHASRDATLITGCC